MSRLRHAVGVVVLAAGWSCAPAQTNLTDAPRSMTLDDCLARALAAAETEGLFEAEPGFARADLMAARARSYPHLNLRPELRYYPNDGQTEPFLSADLGRHFLEIPQNRLQRRIARRSMAAALREQDRGRRQRRRQVVTAYIDVLEAAQHVALATRKLELTRQTARAWDRIDMDAPGVRTRTEAARTALAAARAQQEQADLRHRQARRQLYRLCNVPADQAVEFQPLPGFTPSPVDLDTCMAWARRHRGDLARLRHETETLDTLIRLARLGRWPTAGLSFGYTERGRDEFDDTEEGGVFAGLQVHIPLWDAGSTQATIERLRARRRALDTERAAQEGRIRKTVSEAFLAVNAATAALHAVEADSAPERQFQTAEIEFGNGRLAALDLAAATLRRAEHQAEKRYRNLDCHRARTDLLAAIGATREEWAAGLDPARETGMDPP